MTPNSVLSSNALHLKQAYIYRARILINAPGALATESKVSAGLAEQGFADISFLDKSNLPADWPADQADDPSGMFSWTAYLQGRFTLSDRIIPLSALPSTVQVQDMWIWQAPMLPPPPPAPPQPPAYVPPPLTAIPLVSTVAYANVAPPLTGGERVGAALVGGVAGWWIGRAVWGKRKR